MRWAGSLLAMLACTHVAFAAAPCAATVSEAVLQALALPAASLVSGGYRVRDVVLDAALGRSFVRVEHCGHAEQPLTLLPFAAAAAMHSAAKLPVQKMAAADAPHSEAITLSGATRDAPTMQVGTAVSVTMGDERSSVLVRGRLLTSATVGSDVDVELAALEGSDGPGRHVRGRLLDDGRVEVHP